MFSLVRRLQALATGALLAAFAAACAAPAATPGSLLLFTETPSGSAGTSPTLPAASSGLRWDSPPPMTIDPAKIYLATVKTEKGDIEVELFAAKAPVTVNNFIFLARQGYYDGTTFHRVLDDFMAQGGDPTGTGGGGPGYAFQDEFHPDLRFDEPGLLAMANSGADTNGSQFFITFVPTPHLTGRHTIFGKVVAGMDVALSLTRRDPNANPTFTGDRLLTVEIEESEQSLLPPATATPPRAVAEPAEGRPLAELSIADRAGLYNAPPAMVIDADKTYLATIATSQGDIVAELYPADAPQSVNNFVVLAGLGYWDGFPISFVDPGVFVLTGSPEGTPQSDVGYVIAPEMKRPNTAGALGYWYRDDALGSSGSQVYVLLEDAPGFDDGFTVFGQVVEGLDVAGKLTTDDTIETITIEEK